MIPCTFEKLRILGVDRRMGTVLFPESEGTTAFLQRELVGD